MTSDAEFKRRIRRGIALLDKKYGRNKWRKKVRLRQLDMSRARFCILGQTDSSYDEHKDRLNLTDTKAISHGFFTRRKITWSYDNLIVDNPWDRLTDLWKDALKKKGKQK